MAGDEAKQDRAMKLGHARPDTKVRGDKMNSGSNSDSEMKDAGRKSG